MSLPGARHSSGASSFPRHRMSGTGVPRSGNERAWRPAVRREPYSAAFAGAGGGSADVAAGGAGGATDAMETALGAGMANG
jgi:hypothetical protein